MSNKQKIEGNAVHHKNKDVLYFDGQCPICSGEVKKLKPLVGTELVFADINQVDDVDLSKETLFSQLHLKRADGTWAVGLEANVIAWQHTRWHRLANVLMWPVVKPFASLGYKLWLLWYQRQRKKRQANSGHVTGR